MFGLFRAILALAVVAQHMGGPRGVGGYAVFAFFALSGYLMTLIMHRSYGYSRSGRWHYAVNRFLRIYPLYWVSILTSIALVTTTASAVHREMYVPRTLLAWAQNLGLILGPHQGPRLTPPAWALTIELAYYLLIGLGLSKTRRITWVWFAFGVAWHVLVAVAHMGYDAQYFQVPAGSLPFAAGALVYHYRDQLMGACRRLSGWTPLALLGIMIANWRLGDYLGEGRGIFFYINLAMSVAMIILLIERPLIPFLSVRLDRFFGDLSYPIYLMHYQVALFVVSIAASMGVGLARPNHLLLAIVAPLVVFVAWVLSRGIARPLEKYRDRFRL